MKTCKDCPFWDQDKRLEYFGRCRFNPPTLINPVHGDGVFPNTNQLDWCRIVRPELANLKV
jgi:hypothetical protein